MKEETLPQGTLYIVGTPIGNLEDITLRAIRILQSVDLIAAEDTRHTGKLLHHFQITTPQLSYHHHNRLSRQGELIDRLRQGQTIALVTDAGMPGISDPGYDLIVECVEAGLSVVPVPGPTAAVSALAVSGLRSDRFVFEGFLPNKGKDRRSCLQSLLGETRTIILYEAPHRLLSTLADLAEVLGKERCLTVAREITKLHEEFWRGTLADALVYYQHPGRIKGEFTLVVAGTQLLDAPRFSDAQLKGELVQLLKQGMTRSQATRHLADMSAVSRRHLYQLALKIADSDL